MSGPPPMDALAVSLIEVGIRRDMRRDDLLGICRPDVGATPWAVLAHRERRCPKCPKGIRRP